ncbi:MAG: hypothetical protein FWC77_03895 [Defluviitaleaceae bacterium]|nr:hypothetical protein [Defluviitaleaceae bacterium]
MKNKTKFLVTRVLAIALTLMLAMGSFQFVLWASNGDEPATVVPRSSFADFTEPEDLIRQSLIPDLLYMWDGTPVTTPQQWEERRQEIRYLLEYYMYGPVRITPNYVEHASHTVTGTGTSRTLAVTLRGGPDARNLGTGASTAGITAILPNFAITLPAGTPPPGGWPLILGAPHSAAFWHARGFATAAQPTGRVQHDALFGPRLNTVWYRNTGAYGIAAWHTEMLILGLRAEAEGLNRIGVNPDRVAVSGASTNGKRAAAIGAMAESVWLSIPGAGGTGAANMYRQNSANTVWNMFSGPSTLAGAPGTFPGSAGANPGFWGPIGLAESWAGHAGWDGNYGGHYRNIPNLNADFAPIDIHFVAAMYARADGGKFFMPATGIAMESTNGVPGIQQMIDYALPAFTLAGVPHNLGARVTRAAHGVDFEATAVILATIQYLDGTLAGANGYPNMQAFFASVTGANAFSAAVQTYINGLNFNIAHMHITPFASPQNAETFLRIQPTCNGDCNPCQCPPWCAHTADGMCCDPGVPPIDPNLVIGCIRIDFVGPDNDANALRMGRPRQSLGWNQGANVGVVNANGFLERRFTNHGGGIIFNLPLGEAKLGNFDQLQFSLRVTAASGANSDSPVTVVFVQNRDPFPGSGNWYDGVAVDTRMSRPYAGVNVLGTYTFDLTTPFLDEGGSPLPVLTRGLTNYARWMTGNVSVAIGRNNHTSTMEFGHVWLRAIGCATCCAEYDVYFSVGEGHEAVGSITASAESTPIESGDTLTGGTMVTFTAAPSEDPILHSVSHWTVNGEVYRVNDVVFTGNELVLELLDDIDVVVYFEPVTMAVDLSVADVVIPYATEGIPDAVDRAVEVAVTHISGGPLNLTFENLGGFVVTPNPLALPVDGNAVFTVEPGEAMLEAAPQVFETIISIRHADIEIATLPVSFEVMEGVCREDLAAAIDYANALLPSDFTRLSWALMSQVHTQAVALYNNIHATEEAVEDMTIRLWAAIDNLVPLSPAAPPVDRAALIAAIDIAETFVQSEFTRLNWVLFHDALTHARAVRDNANATQEQVNAALLRLTTTMENRNPS